MKKALRIFAIVLGSIVLLILVVMIWLTTPSGENFIRQKAVAYFHKKFKTEVRIDNLHYKLPEMVEMKGVYFADRRGDTMLAASRLRVDINMFKLLSNQVVVKEIQLE